MQEQVPFGWPPGPSRRDFLPSLGKIEAIILLQSRKGAGSCAFPCLFVQAIHCQKASARSLWTANAQQFLRVFP